MGHFLTSRRRSSTPCTAPPQAKRCSKLAALVCLFAFLPVAPATLADAQWTWDGVEKVIAIGDVHGAHKQLVNLLTGQGLIDSEENWSGGRTHLVSLGDLLDRGPDSRLSVELFIKLQAQAEAAGGRVHVVMGNHELMNITGDLRDVSEAEYAALGGPEGHRELFALDGRYGAWIADLPFVIRINDTAFAHGGFSSLLTKTSLQVLNTHGQKQLKSLLQEAQLLQAQELIEPSSNLLQLAHSWPETSPPAPEAFIESGQSELFGDLGPLWYRGTAACHALLETPQVNAVLKNLGVKRLVIGHTPTAPREISSRFDGQVFAIDTGMLAKVYRGNPRALEIQYANETSTLAARDVAGEPVALVKSPIQDPFPSNRDVTSYDTRIDADGALNSVVVDDESFPFEFERLNARAMARAVAAYKIDRLLGLHMVPATYAFKHMGARGVILYKPTRYLTERTRSERGFFRPSYCEGVSDYQLVAAFDALIGQRARGLDNLQYNSRNWEIRLVNNGETFGTSRRPPAYKTPQKLPHAFATQLEELTFDTLKEVLGGELKDKEIRALLARRDTILSWPRVGTAYSP